MNSSTGEESRPGLALVLGVTMVVSVNAGEVFALPRCLQPLSARVSAAYPSREGRITHAFAGVVTPSRSFSAHTSSSTHPSPSLR